HASYYALANVDSSAVPAGTVVGFVDSNDAFSGLPTVPPTPQDDDGDTEGATGSLADITLEVHSGASTVVVTGSSPATFPITDDSTTDFTINGDTTADLAGITTIDALIIALNNDTALTDNNIVAS